MSRTMASNDLLRQKPRKQWVDFLRAFAIFLVIFGHHAGFRDFFIFTSPIKMPLFFAVSGYLFNDRNGDDRVFFKRLFYSIIVPWLILGFLPPIMALPIRSVEHVTQSVIDIFLGKLFWFMPCFIIGQSIFYYIVKYCRQHVAILLVVSCLLFFFALFLKSHDWLDACKINTAFSVQLFFAFGYMFKRYENKLMKLGWGSVLFLFLIYITLGVISKYVFPNRNIDVNSVYYYYIPISLSMVFIGLLICFLGSIKIQNYPKWLLLVGINSLVIYMWDGYFMIPKQYLFNFFDYPIIWRSICGCIYIAYSSLLGVIAGKLLHRYIPWATGNRG